MFTAKKKIFADYYLTCFNQTEAARYAGYTSKRKDGVTKKAYELMKDPEVKAYISHKLKEKEDGLIVKQNDVLKYLSGCVKGTEKEKKLIVLRSGGKEGYDDDIVEREQDLQPKDRIKAAEIMCKIYNMMDNKNNKKKPQKVVFNIDIPKGNNKNE